MLYGIIDLGSNTIRLSIYKAEDKTFKLLLNEKSFAGLVGYVEEGVMSEKGINKACETINSFKELASDFNIEKLNIFATASLRNIANTEDVIKKIETETGLRPDVLTGDEEALFGFYGATYGTEDINTGLFIDIGGGSTELLYFEGGHVVNEVSLPIGCLNLYLKYIEGFQPSREERKKIKSVIKTELDKVEWLKDITVDCIYGAGGTIRAVKKVCGEFTDNGSFEINSDNIKNMIKDSKDSCKKLYKTFLKIVPERVHTIIPGMIILKQITKSTGAQRIIVSKYGVREGYLISKVLAGEKCE